MVKGIDLAKTAPAKKRMVVGIDDPKTEISTTHPTRLNDSDPIACFFAHIIIVRPGHPGLEVGQRFADRFVHGNGVVCAGRPQRYDAVSKCYREHLI